VKILKRYGVLGFLRLCRDIIITKLLNPRQRIIRRPFYLRGRSRIRLGRNLTTGVGVRIEAVGNPAGPICLSIGNDVEINDYVHIGAFVNIYIGDNVLIASRVFITDHNHGEYSGCNRDNAPHTIPGKRKVFGKPVRIEDRVWIGEGVCILPGVSIGEGSIIGAGAVVTKDVAANSIAVGNPAKVVRVYNVISGYWERS
jgi:lipopolysaccharide O-acetyltransferase